MKANCTLALAIAGVLVLENLGRAAPGPDVSTRDYWPTAGWKTAAPEEYGFDTNALAAAIQQAPQICPQLHSLLVVRQGRLVVERYFNQTSEKDAWNVKSASKSMISALIGVALEQGYIRSLDQPAIDFFPEYRAQLDDPRKSRITIRHLLTMTAGLEWSENGPITFRWLRSRDRVGFTWKSKLVAEPGTRWNYSTATTHLLSAILTKATGTNTLAFARRALFDPLGASVDRWDQDRQGYYIGGSEVYLTPRDMAKFGYLYLNRGRWDGKQIVPESWVQASTEQSNSAQYGFLWWMDTFEGRPIYFAQGFGGQHIVVVPHLDVVVVTTAYMPTHYSALTLSKLWVLPCINRFEPAARELPSAEKVIGEFYRAIGGREQLAKLESLRILGRVEVPAKAERGTFEVLKGGRGKILSQLKGARLWPGSCGSDGTTVWSNWRGYGILSGERAQCWRDEAHDWSDLRRPVEGMKTVAVTPFAGKPCYQLQLRRETGEFLTDYYDVETGLLAGSIRSEGSPYGLLAVTRLFNDYRRWGVFQFPSRIVTRVQGPEGVLTRTAIQYNGVDTREFDLPIPIEDILKGKPSGR